VAPWPRAPSSPSRRARRVSGRTGCLGCCPWRRWARPCSWRAFFTSSGRGAARPIRPAARGR